MKVTLLVAAGLTASVNGAVIDERQFRPTTRPSNPGTGGDGIASPLNQRNAQYSPPWFSIGNPTQTVTFFPNDPDDRGEKHFS
jgi:hypothetical protein